LLKLIPFAFKIEGIHSQYKKIHYLVTGESLRNIFYRLLKKVDYCHCVDELQLIKENLTLCMNEFCCEENLIMIPGPSEAVALDLCKYIHALLDSVGKLQQISAHHCNLIGQKQNHDLKNYRQSIINYDNSIQKYRQIGIRLNKVFSK